MLCVLQKLLKELIIENVPQNTIFFYYSVRNVNSIFATETCDGGKLKILTIQHNNMNFSLLDRICNLTTF